MKARRQGQKKRRVPLIGTSRTRTYLGGIHFEFSHDLDGGFAVSPGVIFGTIHIAEGTVAHLFEQSPSVQAWIFGQFALALPLFCNDSFDDRGIHFVIALNGTVSDLHLLMVTGSSGSSFTCLGGAIAIVYIGNGEVGRSASIMLQRLVVENIGI